MKKITFLLLFSLLPAAALTLQAESPVRKTFYSITGKDTTVYLWNETVQPDSRKIIITAGTQVTEIISGSDLVTRKARITDTADRTDITITLENGVYTMDGRFRGEEHHKTVKSKGLPWIQNISYSVGVMMKNHTSYKYECFRPDNLDFEQMQAEYSGEGTFLGMKVHDIRISPGGMKSLFWSCHYYLDESGEYAGYRGVNGGPGTPETIIVPGRM